MNSSIYARTHGKPSEMEKEERKSRVRVSICLTPEEKHVLKTRSEALGMSMSTFLRESIINHKRMNEEVLAREWVATALLLRRMQSGEDDDTLNLRDVLKQIRSLIQRSLSR